MDATLFSIRNKLVYVFVLSVLLASWARAEEESKLAKTLAPIRAKLQSKGLSYEEVAQMTAPLLREYKDDNEALGQIYRLRVDFAQRSKAGAPERLAELRALVPLLPADDAKVRLRYEEMLSVTAKSNGQETYDVVYADKLKRLGILEEDRYLLMRAHFHAACVYVEDWKRPADAIAAFNALVAACDFNSKRDVDVVWGMVQTFLNPWCSMNMSEHELRGLLESARPHLSDELAKRWEPGITPHLVRLQEKQGAFDALLQTAEDLIAGNPREARYQFYRIRAYRGLRDYSKADATAREIILAAPESPDAFNARTELVENSLVQRNLDEALGRARLAFDVASSQEEITQAIQLIIQTMSSRDRNSAGANRFLLYQRCGRAGTDGKMDTQDDLPSFKDTVPCSIDPAFEGQLVQAAEKEISILDAGPLRRRGMLYLHAGKPEKALEAFEMQYRLVVASAEMMQSAVNGIATATRAASFQTSAAKAFL